MDDEALERDLEPFRTKYAADLTALEQRWANEINALIKRVGKAIYPLPVSDAWVAAQASLNTDLGKAHAKRCDELDDEYLQNTKGIVNKHMGAQ